MDAALRETAPPSQSLARHSKVKKSERTGNLFHRNCKARAFAFLLVVNGDVDANEFAHVDQRPATVAGVDVRIGLQPVLKIQQGLAAGGRTAVLN